MIDPRPALRAQALAGLREMRLREMPPPRTYSKYLYYIDGAADVADGMPLGAALKLNELASRENVCAQTARACFTPIQRAAVSAHWSAELRAKIAVSKERERCRVLVDIEAE